MSNTQTDGLTDWLFSLFLSQFARWRLHVDNIPGVDWPHLSGGDEGDDRPGDVSQEGHDVQGERGRPESRVISSIFSGEIYLVLLRKKYFIMPLSALVWGGVLRRIFIILHYSYHILSTLFGKILQNSDLSVCNRCCFIGAILGTNFIQYGLQPTFYMSNIDYLSTSYMYSIISEYIFSISNRNSQPTLYMSRIDSN